jgi:hypothetical protein
MKKKSYFFIFTLLSWQVYTLQLTGSSCQIVSTDNADSIKIKKDKTQDSSLTKPKLEFIGRLYSDFVGLKADNPNGLIQTKFLFSYTRQYDSLKCTIPFKNSFEIVPFRNVVLADFAFSKIDQKNRELPVRYNSDDSISGYLNRLDLYQYAYFSVTGKLNLFTVRCFSKCEGDSVDKKHNCKTVTFLKSYESFRLYFDLIGTFYNTSIADSLKRSNMTSVNSIAWGINIRATFYPTSKSNLKAEIEYTHFFPSLFTHTYKEIAGPQYLAHTGLITQSMIDERKYAINSFDLVFVRNNDNKSAQFLRLSIIGNFFARPALTSPNLFYQLQLGTDFTLNDLFKKKE